eukprot:GHVR01127328.1.p1 GENE.GHVR01127328.1~~GHVR01127328.1.p1  ORF type:complete len:222 (+),score=-0.41 GHVR01127328.1:52-717(+)
MRGQDDWYLYRWAFFYMGCSNLPGLTDADLPNTAPCPEQDLLTDSTFQDDLDDATAFIVTYDSSDNAGGSYCSRDDYSLDTTSDVTMTLTNDLDDFLTSGVGIEACGDSIGTSSFPQAGTYRKDAEFTANGRTYKIRIRMTVTAGSPDVLGDALTTESVDDLTNDVTYYKSDGSTAVTASVTSIKSFLKSILPSGTLVIKDSGGSDTYMTLKAEVICAQEQ